MKTETTLELDPKRAAAADIPVLRFLLKVVGKRRTVTLIGVSVAMSLLDLLGIAIVFPYLDAVVRPSGRINQAITTWLPELQSRNLVLMLSAAMIVIYAVKNAAYALLQRYQFREMSNLTARLTNDMVSRLLRARYATFQNTATSGLAGIAYSNTVHATVAFQALVQALNEVLFLSFLLAVLFLLQPLLALSLIAVLAVVYAVLSLLIIRRSTILGNVQRRIENQRYRLLFSIVTAIRDIKIMGLGPLFDARNREISDVYADVAWRHNLNGALPRLFIELVMLTGLVVFVAGYALFQVSLESVAPMLAVGALAALRAVPTFSRVIGALNTYRFSAPVIERLMTVREELGAAEAVRRADTLPFAHSIELEKVGFRYGTVRTLNNVDLVVRRGQSVGIVGPSGSGKTTLLDLITGLQPAPEGRFLCDGQPFDPFTSQSMQQLIGYVPQSITLLDDSIAFNISFEHRPSPERLEQAIRVANLARFVASLPDGVETMVGENGVRLSGGQRQRVGIARAIYREPSILVFDEATSSLDTISERELTAEIAQLSGGITKVIVTHRLSTIVGCDHIYVLSRGVIVDSGTHTELLARCELYRRLYTEEEQPVLQNSLA
jgi:ABC-type bacteriocin/lantibiotic exporter with double-glycine peptidase domain